MLSDAAETDGAFVTLDHYQDHTVSGWEVRFSADDKVCELSLIDEYAHTTVNSPTNAWQATAGGTTAAPTCTGGATAFTTATGWHTHTWSEDVLLYMKRHTQSCYTIGAETTVADLADIVTTLYIDTYTVNQILLNTPDTTAATTSADRATVTITRGLASSGLLMWLFIILLLGGGGGAAYYFMVMAPATA